MYLIFFVVVVAFSYTTTCIAALLSRITHCEKKLIVLAIWKIRFDFYCVFRKGNEAACDTAIKSAFCHLCPFVVD